jgi:hypothetical protein
MDWFRRQAYRRRVLLALGLALGVLAKAVLPAGFMLSRDAAGGISVVFCTGMVDESGRPAAPLIAAFEGAAQTAIHTVGPSHADHADHAHHGVHPGHGDPADPTGEPPASRGAGDHPDHTPCPYAAAAAAAVRVEARTLSAAVDPGSTRTLANAQRALPQGAPAAAPAPARGPPAYS